MANNNKIGKRASILGLCLNVILALGKIVVGLIVFSNSLVADGINNLGDSITAIISIISFHLASKKPDRTHPFGYERVEYILSLVIGVIIIVFGAQIITEAIRSFFDPTPITDLGIVIYTVLGVSLVVKTFMFFYYRYIGKKINSMEMYAL
ncbi:MAG: cation diffusion facilitator family transporter, partial [Erysipelotrichaceae bacterium]|nr:cation diffusion facilitator family transporter [Erysipelotrichaceae bacterium]